MRLARVEYFKFAVDIIRRFKIRMNENVKASTKGSLLVPQEMKLIFDRR